MTYYSHARINEENIKVGSKKLTQHLHNVQNIAIDNLINTQKLDLKPDRIYQILNEICFYHDLGKYTTYFQNYLLGINNKTSKLKNHSRIGAYCLLNKYQKNDFRLAFINYFIIASHHGNLKNIKNTEFFYGTEGETIKKEFEQQKSDLEANIDKIYQENNMPDFKKFLCFPDYRSIRIGIKNEFKIPHIQNYFLINYLYSLLTEADKLDASETPVYTRQQLNENAVDDFLPRIDLNSLPTPYNTKDQNTLRNIVRGEVIQQLDNPDILDYKLFTLTAPTGIGKTLTSLDFALKLKAKIRDSENHEAQIIYVLPFINIIEQAFDVYTNQVFRQDVKYGKVNILAHYQYADVFEDHKKDESNNYQQKIMQLDTWQSDIVITSFVQFFETLISNRNKLLKKFHHFAGSIIILDEVQTIKLDLMPLIGAVLHFLTKFLDARVIMMTATQPKIFSLAYEYILKVEGEKAKTKELLPSHDQIFQKFERTRIIPLIDEAITNEDFVDFYQRYWDKSKSCIIVCNTVKRSIELYEQIKELGYENKLYYLSTNIVPAQRQIVVEKLRTDLITNKKPILISTQVVEAGVDLDFDMGFRDIGPIDSIIQVAGRINRENSEERKHSSLYVVNFTNEKNEHDAAKVYGDLTIIQASKALKTKDVFYERDYKALVDSYFENISEKEAFDKSIDIFNSLKTLRYDGEKKDNPVSSFKIIEQAPWTDSVFIENDDNAMKARKAFQELINGKMEKAKFDRFYKLTFHQHIIAVPNYLPKAKELYQSPDNQLTEDILLVQKEFLHDYYDKITGFKRSKESEINKTHIL